MRLFIECSTSVAVVAIETSEKTTVHQQANQKLHSKYMLSMIDSLLREVQVTPQMLTSIVVGEGPGSYTGARIAVTIAKMLALQLHIPLFAFDSLSLFATNESHCAVQLLLKRETVLGGVYDLYQGQIIHAPTYYTQAEWDKLTKGISRIEPHEQEVDLSRLILKRVDDISSFSPNYAREWQPT